MNYYGIPYTIKGYIEVKANSRQQSMDIIGNLDDEQVLNMSESVMLTINPDDVIATSEEEYRNTHGYAVWEHEEGEVL